MQSKSFIHLSRFLIISVMSMALLSCFGDGDGEDKVLGLVPPPVVLPGMVVNSNVDNIMYVTSGGDEGFTDDGAFPYFAGETCTFYLGGILLGLEDIPCAALITPVEMTDSNSPLDPFAANLYVFFQTLDTNSPNSGDGIQISDATLAALADSSLDFDVDPATFNTNFQAVLDDAGLDDAIVDTTDAVGNFCQDTYLPGGGEDTFGYPFPGCELDADVELLTNGNFESPDADGGDIPCATDWECFNDVLVNSNNFDSGNGGPTAHSPDQTVKIFGPFTQGQGAGLFQDVPAIPNATYTATAWVQNWTGGDGSALNNLGIMQLTFFDDTGGEVGSEEIIVDSTDDGANTFLTPDTWVELSIMADAPADAATVRVQLLHIQINCDPECGAAAGGSVFWDDASLIGPPSDTTPPPTGSDLLTNGDFESPDADVSDIECVGDQLGADWGCFNTPSITSNNSGAPGPTALSPDQTLKMYGPFSQGAATGAYQSVEASEGETYTAEVWVQNWSGDPLTNLGDFQLRFLDGGNEPISTLESFVVGAPDGDESHQVLTPDTWTKLSLTGTAPADTASAQIQLLHIQINCDPECNGLEGGSIYWDDARLLGDSPFEPEIPEGFTLVFSDEFNEDGPVQPNALNWTAEIGNGPPDNPVGFGNNEWQYYTMNLDNLRVEDGNLVIQARCETAPCVSETQSPNNQSITSGKVVTKDKFEFQNGIVRARIKASGGFAAWPAFWGLGADYPDTPWPNAGEMDIMELFQNNSSPFTTHSTIHFCNDDLSQDPCNFDNGWTFLGGSKTAAEAWSDDFHVYELEWTDDLLIFRVDGSEVFTQVIDPDTMEEFRKPYYLILNLAMGGNLGPGGNQPPDPDNTFVHTSLIDWVRVYQEDVEPPPPPPEGDELLTNDGFELPDVSGGDQACSQDWMCFGGFGIDQNFTTVSGSPLSGTQNLKQFGTDAGAFQDVVVIPGETYTVSAWARNDSSDPLNNVVLVQLFFYDGAGNNISGGFNAFAQEAGSPVDGGDETFLPSNTWVQLSASGVAPANAVTARIQVIHTGGNVTGGDGGSVFWDDPSLIGPGSEPPPPAGELTLFADELASGWALFLEGAATAEVVTDADSAYGEVIEFSTPGMQVVGITSRSLFGGDDSTVDASNYAVLEFDLKMTAAPPATDIWRLKVENPATEIVIDTPVLDTWVHYSIPVSELGNPAALDVVLIFPDWAGNAGAVYRIDNVKLLADAAPPPPPPAEELTLFADELASGWALFLEGAATAEVVTDADSAYGEVIEFSTPGMQVVGITSRSLFGGDDSTVDASNYAVLEFDLKMTAAPPATDIWRLKVENPATEIVIDTPVLDTWVHYSIPVSELGNPAALDVVLIFPDWAGNAGAVYRIDNVKLLADAAPPPPAGGELTTNGDFEAGNLSGWTVALNGGSITPDNTQASGSTWTGHAVAGPSSAPALSQEGLAVETVNPGDTIDISFDMCGTAVEGGEIAIALLSERGPGEGADRDEMERLSTPALPSVWTRYNYSRTAGVDVDGGVSLQFDVVCGGAPGCSADVFFDNVSVTIGGGPVGGSASGESCAGGPPPPPPPADTELLTNDGFELPDVSGGDQACSQDWMCFGGFGIDQNFTTVSGSPLSGTQNLKQFGTDAGAFQDVVVIPGETYTVSAWARNDSSDPLNNVVLVQLFFYDGAGNNISGGFNAFAQEAGSPVDGGDETFLPSNTWVQLSASGVAPANAVTARIQVIHTGGNVTGGDGGSVFWDDPSLIGPGSEPPPPAGELTLFADELASGWALFLEGAATAEVVTDADSAYGEVIEFSTPGMQVVGITSRSLFGGDDSTVDASNYAVLEFDLKMTAAPPATDIWRLKVENPATEIVIDTPVLDTWVHYSIPVSELGNPAALDVVLIFPDWAGNAGAVYRIDNVKLLADAAPPPPPPAEELTLFADELASGWALFLEGAATAEVVTDADSAYGEVIEFSTPGMQVVGITSRSLFGGDDSTVDASNYAVLEFDLKMTAAPPATDIWRLKVENPATEIVIDTPVLDTWVHYSIPVSELGNPAALDVVLIFPDWAGNAGAVYRIDNVKLLADAAPPPPPPAEELTLFADELASGWALFLEGAATAEVVTDADSAYGEVIEFSTPGMQVVGITSRSLFGGDDSTVDASNYAVLEFDLKMTAAPPATDIWRLKVENPATEIVIDTPVLDTWVHYSIPVSELGNPAALDVVLIFPDWAGNAGAVYRIDNVKLLAEAPPSPPPPVGSCFYESDFDDEADGGLGAPITPNSFAEYETGLADCGTAMAFTAADFSGQIISDGPDEVTTFNDLAGAAGTEGDPGTGSFDDEVEMTSIAIQWYVEPATCIGCDYNYLVVYSDNTIEPTLPAGFSFRETYALTSLTGDLATLGSTLGLHVYSEQSNYSDMVRDTGSDGEIWNGTYTLGPPSDCAGTAGELAVNGDFETGNFDCWTQFPGKPTTTQTIVTDNPFEGTYAARLVIPAGDGPTNNVLKQQRIGAGIVSAGQTINFSFNYRGTTGPGALLAVKSICETTDPVCGNKEEPVLFPGPAWTPYSGSFLLQDGAEPVQSYTLEFAAICGGDPACSTDFYIDNVHIWIAP